MAGGHETEVNIQTLSWGIGCANTVFGPPFFASLLASGQSPAFWRIRFTLFGLTRGTQLLPLANSSEMRRLPHVGFAYRIFTTLVAIAGAV